MKKVYDWEEIQRFCKEQKPTWDVICDKYGCSRSTLYDAMNNGYSLLVKENHKEKYDWEEIQEYYDSGKTQKEISDKFGCSGPSITKASHRRNFVPRTRSGAMKLSNKRFPRTHTEETKRKISEARKEYLRKNPDKTPYLLNHYSKGPSYPEKYFAEVFENEKIKLEKYYQFGLYQLDFADPERKIDIEIDGGQHRHDKKIIEHDIKRNNFLASKGWVVFRVYWPEYQKKTREEKEKVVGEMRELLKNPSGFIGNNQNYQFFSASLDTKENEQNIRKIKEKKIKIKKGKGKYKKTCICCNKEFETVSENQKFCGYKCHQYTQRRTQRPSKGELEIEISISPMTHIGKKYGVSSNAVKKWCKAYGIVLEDRRGYWQKVEANKNNL